MRRAAFSLIELILAIVIIAISVMTIPLMLSESMKNDTFTVMQESILAARTKMGNILSYEWDRNSTMDDGSYIYIRVIDVINGDSELDRNSTTFNENRRIGHIPKDRRRRFHDGNTTTSGKIFPSTIIDENNISSITDFNQQNIGIDANSSLDYLSDFNITTTISYISDETDYSVKNINFDFNVSSAADITDINKSTNIKMIELLVQISGGNPFRLRTFSSNIGQLELLEYNP